MNGISFREEQSIPVALEEKRWKKKPENKISVVQGTQAYYESWLYNANRRH
jgi:hypothetical protein